MTDAFDILALDPRFDLSPASIERAWLTAIASAHPDTTTGDSTGDHASRLNLAKEELEDSETRANLLLVRLGGPSAEDDKSLPKDFLMEIFGVREEMEEKLQAGGDEPRRELGAWADARRSEHISTVGELFERAGEAGVLVEIRQLLNVWRYTERMIEQLDPGYDPNVTDFR